VDLYLSSGNALFATSGYQFTNVTMTSSSPQNGSGGQGLTASPAMISKNTAQLTISGLTMSSRGIWMQAPNEGSGLTIDNRYEMQGAVTPFLTLYSATSPGGYVDVKKPIMDTSGNCTIFNASSSATSWNAPIYLGFPSAALNICGNPVYSLVIDSTGGSSGGQNTNMEQTTLGLAIDGTFATNNAAPYAVKRFAKGVEIEPAYSLHTVTPQGSACTASASGAGTFNGTATFNIVPVYPDNGEGGTWATCSVSGLSSNGVALSYPQATSAQGYDIYYNGTLVNLNSCAVPQTAAISLTLTAGSSCGPSQPTIAASGPSAINAGQIWAPILTLAQRSSAPSTTNFVTRLYQDPTTNWPSFKSNGSGAYQILGVTGAVTTGHTACFSTSVTGAMVDCAGGGGTTNNASQYSDPIYSAAGSSNIISGNAAPTVNGKWTVSYNVVGGVAVAKTNLQSGLAVTSGVTGATSAYTVTFTDCSGQEIVHDQAGSSNVGVTLPTATTLTNPACVFVWANHSTHTDTITPTTWTIQGNAAAAGATLVIASGVACRISVDTNNATNWLGDCSITSGNATTVNGASVPASLAVAGTNASSQVIAATGHKVVTPLVCLDTSGSGSAQSCTTAPTFAPAAGDTMIYDTTTTNTGDVTINVNASSAVHVRKYQAGALVVLAAGDLLLGTYPILTYDGTYWEMPSTANTPSTIAAGTAALGTGAITSATCATVVTVGATGVATTDVIAFGLNGDITGVTGYIPSTSGTLYIYAYPTSGNVNFKVCNNTSGSITPGAVTLNWRVSR
jgi:hypothetical protein